MLSEHFARFLRVSPGDAISTLVAIIHDFVTVEHHTSLDQLPEPVRMGDQLSSLWPDRSVIWDNNGLGPNDVPLKLLGAFESTLISSEDPQLISDLIQLIAAHPLCAVIWRRLLRAGTVKPLSVGIAVRSLAWNHTILTARDTSQPSGEFIRAIFSQLNTAERALCEEAVMAIPQGTTGSQTFAERQRDRLLGCIDSALLVTQPAREQRARLEQGGGPPSNPPEFQIQFGALGHDPFLHLREEGVQVEATETQAVLLLLKPVAAFTAQHRNEVPEDQQITASLVPLATLAASISAIDLPSALENHVLSDMAEAASRMLLSDTYQWDETSLNLIRSFLLRALRLAAEPTDAERDPQFAKSPGWGMPDARVSAAEALLLLGRQSTMMNEELSDVILELIVDPDVKVRYQTAAYLNCVSITAPTSCGRPSTASFITKRIRPYSTRH